MTVDRRQLGKRIREERERCGLTQQELARALRWKSHASVVALEGGERELKAFELFQIADALHVDANSFFESVGASRARILWRKKPKAQRQLLEQRFNQRCEEIDFLERVLKDRLPTHRRLPQKALNLKTADLFWANELAEAVRRELELGSLPASTLFPRLEEEFGVRIFSEPMGKDGSAACCYYTFGPAIFLNREEIPWRQVFSIAHELFHLVTWDAGLIEAVDGSDALHTKNETLADAFAAGLLMPEDLLRRDVRSAENDGKLSYGSMVVLARKYGVSTTAVLFRLRYLGFLSNRQMSHILDDPGFRNLDKQSFGAALAGAPELGARFVRLAVSAYREGKISRARLARLVGATLIDLPDVLSSHGFPEVGDEEFTLSAP